MGVFASVNRNMANSDTTQTGNRTHSGGGNRWSQSQLEYHSLRVEEAQVIPTVSSFERYAFGTTVNDRLYTLFNGANQAVFRAYGDKSVDFEGNVYSMGGGNILGNSAFGLNSLISNVTGVNISAYGTNSGRLITSGSNSAIFGTVAVANATSIVTSALFGAGAAENVTGTINGAVGMGNAVFRNAASLIRVLGLGSSVMQTAGGNFTDVVGLGHNSFRATATTIINATSVGSGGQELIQTGGNTSMGYKVLNLATGGTNNAVFGTLAASAQTTASNVNIVGCNTPNTGNFSNLILFGNGATATANGQVHFGSAGSPIATVVNQTVVSDKTVELWINGVAYEFLVRQKP